MEEKSNQSREKEEFFKGKWLYFYTIYSKLAKIKNRSRIFDCGSIFRGKESTYGPLPTPLQRQPSSERYMGPMRW